MDKLLDFLVSYIKDIFVDKKGYVQIKWVQLCLLLVIFVLLSIAVFLGYLDGGKNEVLKEISIFSFYVIIVMIFLGIIGIGGLKNMLTKKKEDTYNDNKDIIDSFKGKTGKILDILKGDFKRSKKILTVKKVLGDIEINVWLDENDIDFGQIYVRFPKELIYLQNYFNDHIYDLYINPEFEDDTLVYKNKFKITDLDDNGKGFTNNIDIIDNILSDIIVSNREILENIGKKKNVSELFFQFLKVSNKNYTKKEIKFIFDTILPSLDIRSKKFDDTIFTNLSSDSNNKYGIEVKGNKGPLIEITDGKVYLTDEGEKVDILK